MKRIILVLSVLLLALASNAWGACNNTTCIHGETGTCHAAQTCSQADVAECISEAGAGGNGTLDGSGNARIGTFDGDGIYVPAGNCTWGSNVNWLDKNLLIIGAGEGTCSPTTSAPSCSCNSSTNTCITATAGSLLDVFNPKMSSTSKSQWRITGFYMVSAADSSAIMIGNFFSDQILNAPGYGWRLDHLTINYPSASREGIINITGPAFGLIDHITIVNFGEASIATWAKTGNENPACGGTIGTLCGAYFFSLGYSPGTANRNVTIEDSKFWTSTSGNGTMFDTNYFGGHFIFRHNHIWNGTMYSHWTGAGSINGMWMEFSNNISDGAGNPSNYVARFQGGATGIFFNNTIKNWSGPSFTFGEDRSNDTLGHGVPGPLLSCNGARTWDGNSGDGSAAGWPCLAQTGRSNPGIVVSTGSQVPAAGTFPTYLWNNGVEDACSACTDHTAATCGGCTNTITIGAEASNYIKSSTHPNGDVDFSKTATKPSGAGNHTLTYTPLIYPHPLQQAGGSEPSAPTNFRFLNITWLLLGTGIILGGLHAYRVQRSSVNAGSLMRSIGIGIPEGRNHQAIPGSSDRKK